MVWAGGHDTRFGMVIASCSGEFLAAVAAGPVCRLLGRQGLGTKSRDRSSYAR